MRRRRVSRRGERPAGSVGRLRPLWLAAFTALVVATPLLPSEAAEKGTFVVHVMFWFVTLAGWSVAAALGRIPVRWGCTLTAVALLLVWVVVSTLVTLSAGHPRSNLNVMWSWLSLGAALVLGRQVLRALAECRAVVSVMVGLAVCLALQGYVQYFHSFPQMRREYDRDPDAALAEAGIVAPPGSPERELFESRLYSREPLATFSLTNSLAGFLTPWLLVTLAIAVDPAQRAGPRRLGRVTTLAALGLLAGCWLLTKSRTAWVAGLCGGVILVLYARRTGWRPSVKLLAGIAAGVLLLAFAAALGGGLDLLVLTESSKALRYRVEYWQGTVAMIRDHLWFGCGPGSFQQYYTAYKVPSASETVADPHNFLLEITATLGLPGLAAFLLIGACVLRRAWKASGRDAADRAADEPAHPELVGSNVQAVYWGAAAGVVLAYPVGLLVGYAPDGALWAIGLPVGALLVATWHPWVIAGRLAPVMLAGPLVALLVNLLAAGGISFPGVAISFWLLLLLLMEVIGGQAPRPQWELKLASPAVGRWVLAAVTVVLAVAAYVTVYRPVLHSQEKMTEARLLAQQARFQAADLALLEAARRDPFAAAPWEQLAALRHQRWTRSRTELDASQFEAAAQAWLAHHPHSSRVRHQLGHWQLSAYRVTGQREYLESAIAHYRRAVALHPNDSLGQAQLAWALQLAGDPAAADLAALALRLDALNPHAERKLARQRLFDPDPSAAGNGLTADSAEQLMERVRTQQVP